MFCISLKTKACCFKTIMELHNTVERNSTRGSLDVSAERVLTRRAASNNCDKNKSSNYENAQNARNALKGTDSI
jgi:hypothetical protein